MSLTQESNYYRFEIRIVCSLRHIFLVLRRVCFDPATARAAAASPKEKSLIALIALLSARRRLRDSITGRVQGESGQTNRETETRWRASGIVTLGVSSQAE